MSITGLMWTRKGWPDVLKDVRVTVETQAQQVRYEPFTGPGLRSHYRPDAVAVETSDGRTLKERSNPRGSFENHTLQTTWDDLHLVYFSGYAMWNYLNTPFMFLLPGFETEEIGPWDEHGEQRRRLKVAFPNSVASHCSEQIFHIGSDGLIARLDYNADVSGAAPTAHYVSRYHDFDGIKIATERRAYRRNPDGTPNMNGIAVAIDIRNVTLT
jgi:hypothetical protein